MVCPVDHKIVPVAGQPANDSVTLPPAQTAGDSGEIVSDIGVASVLELMEEGVDPVDGVFRTKPSSAFATLTQAINSQKAAN